MEEAAGHPHHRGLNARLLPSQSLLFVLANQPSCKRTEAQADGPLSQGPMSTSPLPEDWVERQSKSHGGKTYYFNTITSTLRTLQLCPSSMSALRCRGDDMGEAQGFTAHTYTQG
jgi:hypothetical protein